MPKIMCSTQQSIGMVWLITGMVLLLPNVKISIWHWCTSCRHAYCEERDSYWCDIHFVRTLDEQWEMSLLFYNSCYIRVYKITEPLRVLSLVDRCV